MLKTPNECARILRDHGLSQNEIACLVGLSQSTVNTLLNNENHVTTYLVADKLRECVRIVNKQMGALVIKANARNIRKQRSSSLDKNL